MCNKYYGLFYRTRTQFRSEPTDFRAPNPPLAARENKDSKDPIFWDGVTGHIKLVHKPNTFHIHLAVLSILGPRVARVQLEIRNFEAFEVEVTLHSFGTERAPLRHRRAA